MPTAEAAATAERPTAASAVAAVPTRAPSRASQTWAMLIKPVYELDPFACPRCGGQMKVIAFIEPPQGDVIEKTLRGHSRAAMVGGLYCPSSPRAPPLGTDASTTRTAIRPVPTSRGN